MIKLASFITPLSLILILCSACQHKEIIVECRIDKVYDSLYGNWDTTLVAYDDLDRIIKFRYTEIFYADQSTTLYPNGQESLTYIRYCKNDNGNIISWKFYSCCGPYGESGFDSLLYTYGQGRIVSADGYYSQAQTTPSYRVNYYYDLYGNLAIDSQFNYETGELTGVTTREYDYSIPIDNQFRDYQCLQNTSSVYLSFPAHHLLSSVTNRTPVTDGDYVGVWNFGYAFDPNDNVIKYFVGLEADHPDYSSSSSWFYTYEWDCW